MGEKGECRDRVVKEKQKVLVAAAWQLALGGVRAVENATRGQTTTSP